MAEINDNTPIVLTLNLAEVQSILNVLGELPTKSNAFPLMVKVKAQADEQVSKIMNPLPSNVVPIKESSGA